jgi:anaerobic selenocysteine-containing dehydrogenase
MLTSHAATCPLCEAICGIVAETDEGRVVSIRGDKDDPFSRGHVCPKAVALMDLQDDPDRLRRPVRREGASWHEVDWDTALADVARGIRAVQRTHGRDGVAVYLGNPTVHSLGAMLFTPPFVRSLRTRNRYSATSVDQLPHMVAAASMFGHQFLLPIPDVDRTQHLLVFGANPAVSNGSLMTAPDIVRRLKDLRARGGRLVVIDPRRSETADLADEHHFVRPGTDALVLLAMLHVLYAEGRVRPGACGPFVEGLGAIADLAARFAPERVSGATGLASETIARLAREFAAAERAVCYGRVGVSVQAFGGLACWLINVLNVVAGRLDVPGGAMFTTPAVDLIRGRYAGHGRSGRWRSRVRGLPEFGGELPAAALAEEIDTPGDGRIRALVTSAGNPVLSTPNGARLDRGLPSLDFMVSIDLYVNETTRHAHYILPPTSPLERDHYDLIFHALAIRNTAKFSPAVLQPAAGSRHDWQILNELTWRLADGGVWTRARARAVAEVRARLGPRRMLDLALRRGPRGAGWWPGPAGLSVRRLRAAPSGIDLGPLEPCLPGRLQTADKRIALAPESFVADAARLETLLSEPAAAADTQLLLVSRRELRSNNSWMHNSLRLVKGRRRCTLLMHPADAQRRGLQDGAPVTVRSRVGAVDVELQVSDEIAPGVVCLPHGWGHDREGVRLGVAAAHPGASVNDLTDDGAIDPLTGNAAFSGVPVTVEQ